MFNFLIVKTMKTHIIQFQMAVHPAKKWVLLFGFFMSFYFAKAQDPWHQPEDDSTAPATETAWGAPAADEAVEEFGLFVFQFGNGMIATLDEASARDIGNRVGVSNPVRGINKTGDYYAEIMRISMMEAASQGGSFANAQPILLRGFLAPNGKVYKSRAQYENQPNKPLVDPVAYGRYKIELGGQVKVFTL
jgi:hypothetical protein